MDFDLFTYTPVHVCIDASSRHIITFTYIGDGLSESIVQPDDLLRFLLLEYVLINYLLE